MIEDNAEPWPRLVLDEWLPTLETLRRWVQIVGKTRLRLAPFENHWWHCALYATTRGLTTSPMPYGGGTVEIAFDFLHDRLVFDTSAGDTRELMLTTMSVADFYEAYCALLAELGVHVRIGASPNEIPDATPFALDHDHQSYDGAAVCRWWTALSHADRLLKQFRGRFGGKCSPSHFWFGGFDLACTRFSGRPAPTHSGAGIPNCPVGVMIEAYSRECISAGFWPGTSGTPVAEAAFYAYAYPEPIGCPVAPIGPPQAYYHTEMREWILPYESVRTAADPNGMVLEFLERTYHVAASLGNWDVAAFRVQQPQPSALRS
jgi:hypothetical protein